MKNNFRWKPHKNWKAANKKETYDPIQMMLAAEMAAPEKATAEKVAAEMAAAEKVTADMVAAERAAAERATADSEGCLKDLSTGLAEAS